LKVWSLAFSKEVIIIKFIGVFTSWSSVTVLRVRICIVWIKSSASASVFLVFNLFILKNESYFCLFFSIVVFGIASILFWYSPLRFRIFLNFQEIRLILGRILYIFFFNFRRMLLSGIIVSFFDVGCINLHFPLIFSFLMFTLDWLIVVT